MTLGFLAYSENIDTQERFILPFLVKEFKPSALDRKMINLLTFEKLFPPVGTLRSDDGDGNGNATKAIGLIRKKTILHVHYAFLYISLPSLHDYDVKMSNFTMYRGSTQAKTRFPLSF